MKVHIKAPCNCKKPRGQETSWHRHQEAGNRTEARPEGQQITALGCSVLGPDPESRLVASGNPTDGRVGSSQPRGSLESNDALRATVVEVILLCQCPKATFIHFITLY